MYDIQSGHGITKFHKKIKQIFNLCDEKYKRKRKKSAKDKNIKEYPTRNLMRTV